MKAVVYHKYGSPAVLTCEEVQKPTVGDDHVLVRVHAASVNPLDWHTLRGTPFLVRLQAGLLRPKNQILGVDIAGRVEAVGRNVKRFQPGDEVFGMGTQGFAEYVSVRQSGLVLKPTTVTFAQAAAAPVAALTALQALRDKGEIQPGQRVLINGAAGGVGTIAVQIAKWFGAEVTGVCSTRNVAMVRSIGADHVIDYTKADFAQSGQSYDLIIDAVGNRSGSDHKRALGSKGVCVVVGYSPVLMAQVILQGLWKSKTAGKRLVLMLAKGNQADLGLIKELLEAGKVVPVIDRQYPLGEVAEAIRYLEAGHARGKVIITVV